MYRELISNKYPLAFGGCIGFLGTFVVGYLTGTSDTMDLLANASLIAVISAILMKVFTFVLGICILNMMRERQAQEAEAAAEQKNTPKPQEAIQDAPASLE